MKCDLDKKAPVRILAQLPVGALFSLGTFPSVLVEKAGKTARRVTFKEDGNVVVETLPLDTTPSVMDLTDFAQLVTLRGHTEKSVNDELSRYLLQPVKFPSPYTDGEVDAERQKHDLRVVTTGLARVKAASVTTKSLTLAALKDADEFIKALKARPKPRYRSGSVEDAYAALLKEATGHQAALRARVALLESGDWEDVGDKTQRLTVPGGWIYATLAPIQEMVLMHPMAYAYPRGRGCEGGMERIALVFVPNPKGGAK